MKEVEENVHDAYIPSSGAIYLRRLTQIEVNARHSSLTYNESKAIPVTVIEGL
jgi:hypothetical protein